MIKLEEPYHFPLKVKPYSRWLGVRPSYVPLLMPHLLIGLMHIRLHWSLHDWIIWLVSWVILWLLLLTTEDGDMGWQIAMDMLTSLLLNRRNNFVYENNGAENELDWHIESVKGDERQWHRR